MVRAVVYTIRIPHEAGVRRRPDTSLSSSSVLSLHLQQPVPALTFSKARSSMLHRVPYPFWLLESSFCGWAAVLFSGVWCVLRRIEEKKFCRVSRCHIGGSVDYGEICVTCGWTEREKGFGRGWNSWFLFSCKNHVKTGHLLKSCWTELNVIWCF